MKIRKYYKIPRESETGKKILSIIERCERFKDEMNRLKKKYGFKDVYGTNDYLCSCEGVTFDAPPPGWKLDREAKDIDKISIYKPMSMNKVAYKDMYNLNKMRVKRCEIDLLVGQTDSLYHVGYDIKEEYIIITSDDKHKVEGVDVKEITK